MYNFNRLMTVTRIVDLLATGPTFSFEFFPPKTSAAEVALFNTIAELESLRPSFVSVTYGAGGTTRERTRELVASVRRDTSITPMAHLTCIGHTMSEVDEIIAKYLDVGVENILALGGDSPVAIGVQDSSDFNYAIELAIHLRLVSELSIGVAAHPECHPRSPDRHTDRLHLAEKLRVADFAITQFFFEVEHYVRLVEEMATLGVFTPIIPGIMPVTNKSQVLRMAQLSGAAFPQWLASRLADADDPNEVQRIGIDVATKLCVELLEIGVPGLHFYTLNKSTATREIYANLGLPNA